MNELTQLAIAAQGGDEPSLTKLLKSLEPIFRGFFVRRIGARIDVDDLIQNSLMRVAKGLVDLKDPTRLRGFAMKAALFELQDYYRGRYTGKEALFDALSPPVTSSEQRDIGASMDIEKAMSQLSPKARQIVELRESGYRYEEIAEMIGTTEAAIKMQVKRAFDKLRQIITSVFLTLVWLERLMP